MANHKNTINRRDEIVRLITNTRKVTVDELTKLFNVSSVTIRNDLSYLDGKGILLKSYGGALIRDNVVLDESKSWVIPDQVHLVGAKYILDVEEKLKRVQLDELNNLKDDFLSQVAHDLRTPVTSVGWSITNLLDGLAGQLEPRQREYLESMDKGEDRKSCD